MHDFLRCSSVACLTAATLEACAPPPSVPWPTDARIAVAVTTLVRAGSESEGLLTRVPDEDRVSGSPLRYKGLSPDRAAVVIRDTLYATLYDSLTALGYKPILLANRVRELDSLGSLMHPNLQATSALLAGLVSSERTGSILWVRCAMDVSIRTVGREGASGTYLGLIDGSVFTWTDSTATRGMAFMELTSPPNVKIEAEKSPVGTDLYSILTIEEWTRHVLAPSILRRVHPFPGRKSVVWE